MASPVPSGPPVFIINDGKTRVAYTNTEEVSTDLRGRKYMAIRRETGKGVEIEIKVGTAWEVFTAYISRSLCGIKGEESYYRKSAITNLIENEARKAATVAGKLVFSAPASSAQKVDELDEDSKKLNEFRTTFAELQSINTVILKIEREMRVANGRGDQKEYKALEKGLLPLQEEQAKLRERLDRLDKLRG